MLMKLPDSAASITANLLTQILNEEWNVFVASEPDTPDDCITIYDTIGITQERRMVDGMVSAQPGVQIRVRSTHYHSGWEKASDLRMSLAAVTNAEVLIAHTTEVITTDVYNVSCFTEIGQVLPIGPAVRSARRVFTFNCNLVVTHVGSYPI